MDICFDAEETVAIAVQQETIPIQHYLRQPQRLVRAIADPKLVKQLSSERYQLKMRSLDFLNIYHFQPTVTLKVWAGASGTVYLESEDCEIQGIDYINQRFSLNLKGKLVPENIEGKTYLKGKAKLQVKVDLPPPLWLTPKPLLEMTGNGLLKSVLLRIKQKLLSQLLHDYYAFIESETKEIVTSAINRNYELI
jgi:hypothetical protein